MRSDRKRLRSLRLVSPLDYQTVRSWEREARMNSSSWKTVALDERRRRKMPQMDLAIQEHSLVAVGQMPMRDIVVLFRIEAPIHLILPIGPPST